MRQPQALAALRSIEVGRSLIRVSNAGPTGWIDPLGVVRHETAVTVPDPDGPLRAEGVLASVPMLPGDLRTLASRGPWLEWFGLIGLVAATGFRLRARQARGPSRGASG